MKHTLIVLFALLCYHSTFGQLKPMWTDGYFREEQNSYIEVVSATDYSEEIARNKAAATAIERRNLSTGSRVQVVVKNNKVEVTGHDELTVKARVIDEYREHLGNGEHRVSLLMQTAKNPEYEFETVNVTSDYGFSIRAFVPGWGQFHKGQTVKGIAFLTSEVLLATGAVFCEMRRSDNFRKSQETTTLTITKEYRNRADNWEVYRNVAIGAAAGIYVWNLLDAVLAEGRRYVVISRNLHLSVSESGGIMSYGLAWSF
ncbi:hypothetical protein AGMMS49965_00950 [Bacteroidia bacterium]|nr:hypothetical protein AGMMS49965_00950 [Bacteroidia bacterium]